MDTKSKLIELTAQVVAAFVGNNTVPQAELPRLIGEVYRSLEGVMAGEAPKDENAEARPAVAVRKSVTSEYLICLEDGKKFKSLKRHLRTRYNLSPEQYREKWNLPADYPMVAPKYAETRSSLAKRMGLGHRRKDG